MGRVFPPSAKDQGRLCAPPPPQTRFWKPMFAGGKGRLHATRRLLESHSSRDTGRLRKRHSTRTQHQDRAPRQNTKTQRQDAAPRHSTKTGTDCGSSLIWNTGRSSKTGQEKLASDQTLSQPRLNHLAYPRRYRGPAELLAMFLPAERHKNFLSLYTPRLSRQVAGVG